MTDRPPEPEDRVPGVIWLISAGVFAMVTSELMAGGMLPRISTDLKVSLGTAALLISGFAAGQVLGPWLLGLPASRFRPRSVMATLLVAFGVIQAIGILAGWPVLLGMRFLSGAAMSAYFTVAVSTAARLVRGPAQPRALATVFNGATIGTTLGLPLATLAGKLMTWQVAFLLDSVVVVVVALIVLLAFPAVGGVPGLPIRAMVRPLSNRRVWLTFATSAMAIGGTLLAFSFFATILQRLTGVGETWVPWLLAMFGAANIVGMSVVGRITPTGPTRIVALGLLVLAGGLLLFSAAPGSLPVAVVALLLVGVTGTSLNPALTARTIRVGGQDPAIMAMMPTIITGGILLGTTLGGVIVDSPLGLRGPLWVGAAFALVGLLTLLPDRGQRPATALPAALPEKMQPPRKVPSSAL